ncbi:hypothetical protein [Pseudanabaena sp. SR411]|nr:hypothetical protein [Pseudanabaena sp. SR411]
MYTDCLNEVIPPKHKSSKSDRPQRNLNNLRSPKTQSTKRDRYT